MISPELRGLLSDLALAFLASNGVYHYVLSFPPERPRASKLFAWVFFAYLAIAAYGRFRTGT